jgi:hypothetical protein
MSAARHPRTLGEFAELMDAKAARTQKICADRPARGW